MQLVGFVDTGSEAEYIKVLKAGNNKKDLATHVLQMTCLGLCEFRFPFAHFPTKGASQSEIFIQFWQAVRELAAWNFRVVYTNMDGACQNRVFLNMN